MADLLALKQKEKMLTEKLARIKSGEMRTEESAGGKDEAIARNEEYLRGVKQAIADEEKAGKKGGK